MSTFSNSCTSSSRPASVRSKLELVNSGRRFRKYYPSGWTCYDRHVVLGTDLSPGEPDPGEGQHIDFRLCPVDEVLTAVRKSLTH